MKRSESSMPKNETFLFANDPTPPAKQSHKNDSAQQLLDWLQRWNKDFVSARDIRIYGPGPIRNQKDAVATARILARNGQLTPIGSRRPYLHKWRIVR